MKPNITNFIGCDNPYEESNIVLFGAPFDSTTSFRPGTRFASSAIRNESFGIETYSPYQDKDLLDFPLFDAGDLELPFGSPEKALEQIEDMSSRILIDGKIPCMIGGEHLVTLGAVRAAVKAYDNLHVIQFDAHTDLRDDYLGQTLSHATVMRRIYDLIGERKIYQFGIRSGERDEFLFAQKHTVLQKFSFDTIETLQTKLQGVPVYLTIDLDVLDPACFCGTGTPEAGGVTFAELLQAVRKLQNLQIVAMDMNELAPIYDQSGASTALACKFLRELLLLFS